MTVKALCFGQLKEQMQCAEIQLEFVKGMTVEQVLMQVLIDRPELYQAWQGRLMFALNQQHVKKDAVLKDGDEVALMPPMAGG